MDNVIVTICHTDALNRGINNCGVNYGCLAKCYQTAGYGAV